ncbi:MAG: hypothetical protein LBC80_03205 [Treponema sp.]|jgi:hypothetical protein|nr:hypothetical protein [Treponema sp.]
MKKLIIALLFFAIITPVFAQDDSGTYYVNVSVERIFPSNMGYIIQYRTQTGFHTVGIPNEWFYGAATKGDKVRLPRGTNWPSMSIFYKDGELSHVRLYTHASRGHITWGSLSQGSDVSRFFQDGDTINLQF